MYENYSKKHPEITEKWEIFAEVAREIMCKVSGFEISEQTLRDSIDYSDIVGKILKDKTDKFDYMYKIDRDALKDKERQKSEK